MKILFSLLALPAVLLTSCGPTPPPKAGGAALVDLEATAKRLGRDVAIIDELKTAGNVLTTQLAKTQKDYQDQLKRTKEEIGTTPSDADTQKLAELGRTLTQQFQQKQQEAQQDLAAKRLALVNRFREEVKPVAMKIAAAKGFAIVLVKSDAVVLDNQPSVDITDEVVAEMTRESGGMPSPGADAK